MANITFKEATKISFKVEKVENIVQNMVNVIVEKSLVFKVLDSANFNVKVLIVMTFKTYLKVNVEIFEDHNKNLVDVASLKIFVVTKDVLDGFYRDVFVFFNKKICIKEESINLTLS